MGAGKSTFAREVLRALQVTSAPEGSPTFAIAHEYSGVRPGPGASRIIHLDLYRLEDPEEFEAAGISSYFWDDPEAILLCEWTSLWPDLENALLEDSRHDRWKVRLEFSEPPLNEGRRIRIDRYPSGTGLLEDGANLLK
ncbi:MAG: tRNA ((37)-N6)-threonylcarbamoyltransferase complex ATPase subunit type 1 TsaE [Pseudomonadota bacterium]|jgi:tRNA threonylcarbamoyl adenosine modification protein YjeE